MLGKSPAKLRSIELPHFRGKCIGQLSKRLSGLGWPCKIFDRAIYFASLPDSEISCIFDASFSVFVRQWSIVSPAVLLDLLNTSCAAENAGILSFEHHKCVKRLLCGAWLCSLCFLFKIGPKMSTWGKLFLLRWKHTGTQQILTIWWGHHSVGCGNHFYSKPGTASTILSSSLRESSLCGQLQHWNKFVINFACSCCLFTRTNLFTNSLPHNRANEIDWRSHRTRHWVTPEIFCANFEQRRFWALCFDILIHIQHTSQNRVRQCVWSDTFGWITVGHWSDTTNRWQILVLNCFQHPRHKHDWGSSRLVRLINSFGNPQRQLLEAHGRNPASWHGNCDC